MNRLSKTFLVNLYIITYNFAIQDTLIDNEDKPIGALGAPFAYVDVAFAPETDHFFDRIVGIIQHHEPSNPNHYDVIATGVLIDKHRVLSSYNPFRNMLYNSTIMKQMKVCILIHRKTYGGNIYLAYGHISRTILYARQIVPTFNDELTNDQWHGLDKKHNPVHDLLVIKFDQPVEFREPKQPIKAPDDYMKNGLPVDSIEVAGPLRTKLANSGYSTDYFLILASLGLRKVQGLYIDRYLEVADFEDSDFTDCSNWLPNNWGRFICLKNNPEFEGFASSAMLFSNDTLFGVGSFTLWRGASSILVFTDVRPYAAIIEGSCSDTELQIFRQAAG